MVKKEFKLKLNTRVQTKFVYKNVKLHTLPYLDAYIKASVCMFLMYVIYESEFIKFVRVLPLFLPLRE